MGALFAVPLAVLGFFWTAVKAVATFVWSFLTLLWTLLLFVWSNFGVLLLLVVLWLLGVYWAGNAEATVEAVEFAWRCHVGAFLNVTLVPLLDALRPLWNSLICWWNALGLMNRLFGTKLLFEILLTCEDFGVDFNLFAALRQAIDVVVTLVLDALQWIFSNPFVSRLNLHRTWCTLFSVFDKLSEAGHCLCADVGFVYRGLLRFLTSQNLKCALHQLFDVPLGAAQGIVLYLFDLFLSVPAIFLDPASLFDRILGGPGSIATLDRRLLPVLERLNAGVRYLTLWLDDGIQFTVCTVRAEIDAGAAASNDTEPFYQACLLDTSTRVRAFSVLSPVVAFFVRVAEVLLQLLANLARVFAEMITLPGGDRFVLNVWQLDVLWDTLRDPPPDYDFSVRLEDPPEVSGSNASAARPENELIYGSGLINATNATNATAQIDVPCNETQSFDTVLCTECGRVANLSLVTALCNLGDDIDELLAPLLGGRRFGRTLLCCALGRTIRLVVAVVKAAVDFLRHLFTIDRLPEYVLDQNHLDRPFDELVGRPTVRAGLIGCIEDLAALIDERLRCVGVLISAPVKILAEAVRFLTNGGTRILHSVFEAAGSPTGEPGALEFFCVSGPDCANLEGRIFTHFRLPRLDPTDPFDINLPFTAVDTSNGTASFVDCLCFILSFEFVNEFLDDPLPAFPDFCCSVRFALRILAEAVKLLVETLMAIVQTFASFLVVGGDKRLLVLEYLACGVNETTTDGTLLCAPLAPMIADLEDWIRCPCTISQAIDEIVDPEHVNLPCLCEAFNATAVVAPDLIRAAVTLAQVVVEAVDCLRLDIENVTDPAFKSVSSPHHERCWLRMEERFLAIGTRIGETLNGTVDFAGALGCVVGLFLGFECQGQLAFELPGDLRKCDEPGNCKPSDRMALIFRDFWGIVARVVDVILVDLYTVIIKAIYEDLPGADVIALFFDLIRAVLLPIVGDPGPPKTGGLIHHLPMLWSCVLGPDTNACRDETDPLDVHCVGDAIYVGLDAVFGCTPKFLTMTERTVNLLVFSIIVRDTEPAHRPIFDGGSGTGDELIDAFFEWIACVVAQFGDVFDLIEEAILALLADIAAPFVTLWEWLMGAGADIIDALTSFFEDVMCWWNEVVDFIDGIIPGDPILGDIKITPDPCVPSCPNVELCTGVTAGAFCQLVGESCSGVLTNKCVSESCECCVPNANCSDVNCTANGGDCAPNSLDCVDDLGGGFENLTLSCGASCRCCIDIGGGGGGGGFKRRAFSTMSDGGGGGGKDFKRRAGSSDSAAELRAVSELFEENTFCRRVTNRLLVERPKETFVNYGGMTFSDELLLKYCLGAIKAPEHLQRALLLDAPPPSDVAYNFDSLLHETKALLRALRYYSSYRLQFSNSTGEYVEIDLYDEVASPSAIGVPSSTPTDRRRWHVSHANGTIPRRKPFPTPYEERIDASIGAGRGRIRVWRDENSLPLNERLRSHGVDSAFVCGLFSHYERFEKRERKASFARHAVVRHERNALRRWREELRSRPGTPTGSGRGRNQGLRVGEALSRARSRWRARHGAGGSVAKAGGPLGFFPLARVAGVWSTTASQLYARWTTAKTIAPARDDVEEKRTATSIEARGPTLLGRYAAAAKIAYETMRRRVKHAFGDGYSDNLRRAHAKPYEDAHDAAVRGGRIPMAMRVHSTYERLRDTHSRVREILPAANAAFRRFAVSGRLAHLTPSLAERDEWGERTTPVSVVPSSLGFDVGDDEISAYLFDPCAAIGGCDCRILQEFVGQAVDIVDFCLQRAQGNDSVIRRRPANHSLFDDPVPFVNDTAPQFPSLNSPNLAVELLEWALGALLSFDPMGTALRFVENVNLDPFSGPVGLAWTISFVPPLSRCDRDFHTMCEWGYGLPRGALFAFLTVLAIFVILPMLVPPLGALSSTIVVVVAFFLLLPSFAWGWSPTCLLSGGSLLTNVIFPFLPSAPILPECAYDETIDLIVWVLQACWFARWPELTANNVTCPVCPERLALQGVCAAANFTGTAPNEVAYLLQTHAPNLLAWLGNGFLSAWGTLAPVFGVSFDAGTPTLNRSCFWFFSPSLLSWLAFVAAAILLLIMVVIPLITMLFEALSALLTPLFGLLPGGAGDGGDAFGSGGGDIASFVGASAGGLPFYAAIPSATEFDRRVDFPHVLRETFGVGFAAGLASTIPNHDVPGDLRRDRRRAVADGKIASAYSDVHQVAVPLHGSTGLTGWLHESIHGAILRRRRR